MLFLHLYAVVTMKRSCNEFFCGERGKETEHFSGRNEALSWRTFVGKIKDIMHMIYVPT